MTQKTKIIITSCIWLLIAVIMIFANEKVFLSGENANINVLPLNKTFLKSNDVLKLNFDISKINVSNAALYESGQFVYVTLSKDKNTNVLKAENVLIKRPKDKKYIRGQVAYVRRNPDLKSGYIELNFGIENYYNKRQTIEKLQKDLLDGGVAQVKISKKGSAKITGFKE